MPTIVRRVVNLLVGNGRPYKILPTGRCRDCCVCNHVDAGNSAATAVNYRQNMAILKTPSDALVAVTHRCNARCVMCNIWKSTAEDTLEPEHMRKLPAGLRTVNLTGGEPFLRDDLIEFVREVHNRCQAAQITISTNGYLVERTVRMMEEIRQIDPTVRLAVSIDGPRETHDRIRGGEGFWDNATELVRRLMESDFPGLRLSMTVSEKNIECIPEVAELARSLGLELGIVAAHGARTHLGVEADVAGTMPAAAADIFKEITARWLRSWQPKQWLRAHFAAYTYKYLTDRRQRFRCRAGEDFFFVQADGTLYNCSVLGSAMGNIITEKWSDIWTGQAGCDARQRAKNCRQWCWMICTARSVYRQNAAGVATWVMWHKLLAHLGWLRRRQSLRKSLRKHSVKK